MENVKHIAMGRTSTDVVTAAPDFHHRMERAQNIFKASLDIDNMFEPPASTPDYIFPVVEYSKQEIYDFLPDYIKFNTWSCRKPKYNTNGNAIECGECNTCKDKAKYIK